MYLSHNNLVYITCARHRAAPHGRVAAAAASADGKTLANEANNSRGSAALIVKTDHYVRAHLKLVCGGA